MTKIIELIVSPAGEVRLETRNFAGPQCQDASRYIESALGQRISENLTAEFYNAQNVEQLGQQN